MALKERKIYPKFDAIARGGKLYLDNENKFSQYLLNLEDKTLSVLVKPKTKGRSRQEEKFYHAVVVRMVAEAMDIMDQEAHELLRGFFLNIEEKTDSGIRYERSLSTTELSDKAYREYWEKCIRWAALPTNQSGLGPDSGLELFIPMPNEVDYKDW